MNELSHRQTFPASGAPARGFPARVFPKPKPGSTDNNPGDKEMTGLVELGIMWGNDYEPEGVNRLLPLLESICREIADRVEAIEELEIRRGHLEELAPKRRGMVQTLETQVAMHREELDRAFGELRDLDCSVIGMDPLTIRITDYDGLQRRSFVWRSGDPALSG